MTISDQHKGEMVIYLPSSHDLIRDIKDALDAVSERHSVSALTTGDWFPEIAGEIAGKIGNQNFDCYARGKRRAEPARNCRGSEWLFDFCALINDSNVREEDRFMAQAAVVGEVEWSKGGIDQDFEKLMIVNSLVCFFVWQQIKQHAGPEIDRFFEAAKRRQEYCRLIGMNRPPEFLLSCWVYPEGEFIHCSTLD